ncbi:DEAD/DEAH box helicase [Plebeiibacterium sediminum]|uniref:DEAD/DEAH box helicase n=1 Tax=Plebeiibacterium sediminum TaxID=2992112 RepID=A0AAE3M4R1_9BACT|nr:DEAD/DEAH box helicase [Plebeiobacterium sediminum]MCW3786936.1 DEAD/DEAH box helicase [Plebeiobacterium sediminum]
MKLKKLIPELASGIIDAGFDKEPKQIQSLVIPKIKSGADIFMISPDGTGKTTALVIGTIQQLKEEFEEAPRAIIVTSTKEKAFEIEETIKLLGKNTSLRSFVAFDQGILQYQKDEIYDGLDILVCTPKRLTELVNVNGVPMTKINLIVVDDADEVMSTPYHSIIHRIGDGVKKAQIVFSSNKWHQRFDTVEENLMKNPVFIESEEE